MLEIKILTAYPEIFPGTLGHSILGKALEEKKWSLDIVNLHDFGIDERKNIKSIKFKKEVKKDFLNRFQLNSIWLFE